ncbi:sensor domain-containing protein [Pseudoalteromonas piscicida]|uniref:GGDEF domain-containing protein n=1 Tax=Pseudoalteromonas piscicida TaxID=43662 RepID=A0A2A5JKU8_PSEO7|nr:EAL domain-containing protein [Pseudoalteromonas piscicida]PCK30063.1 GGDEF domain-containing protein [Pseudoalteromonas piscicida]
MSKLLGVLMSLLCVTVQAAELPYYTFSNHSAVMLIIDPATGEIVDANKAAAAFYGYSEAALEAKAIQDINLFTAEQVANERQAALNEGRNYFIFQHQVADGSTKTVSVHSTPFEDSNGRPKLLSIIQDLSEQRKLQQDLWHYQANLEQQVMLQTEKIKQANMVQVILLTAVIGVLIVSMAVLMAVLVRLRHSNQRAQAQGAKLSAIFDSISAYLVFTDETHHIEAANDAVLKDFGEFEQLKSQSIYTLFDVLDSERLLDEGTIECKLGGRFEYRDVRVSCAPVVSEAGAKLGFIYVIQDITDELENEREQRLASTVFATTTEGVLVSDKHNQIQMVNRAFTEITGYGVDEVIGKTPALLNSGRHDDRFFNQLYEALVHKGHWEGEIWNKRKNGEVYPSWLQISSVFNEAREIDMFVALFSDITSRKRNEQLMWQQANFDSLTGLANRHHFHVKFDLALKRAAQLEESFAICFIDLDRFKAVNDTLGHHIGDLLLKEAANRINECVRSSDTVARLGGDEFALLLQDISSINDLEHIASKILRALANPFHLEGHEAYVSGSMGITLYPDDGVDRKILLRNADSAMYKAKEHGRDCFQFYTSAMHQHAKARSVLESALHKALSNRELSLVYQPIFSQLGNTEVVGCEVLLRWKSELLGHVSPEQFIPVCEELGLILPIGEWVLYHACSQAKAWQDSYGRPLFMTVNVSSVQFKRQDMVALVKKVLKDTQLEAKYLTLEITESVLVENSDKILIQLKALRELGVELAIDDFGTGYSSLSYLKRFPLSKLKIDKTFIRDLPDDEEDKALVSAIILMAHKLNLKVIAEGVETPAQCMFLKSLLCDMTQGYFHSKPVAQQDFEANILTLQYHKQSHS